MSYPTDPTNAEGRHQKFASMSIVGHITPKTCKLWVRLYRPAKWWLVVTEQPLTGNLDTLDGKEVDVFLQDQGIEVAYQKAVRIKPITDNTHTFTVSGLKSGKRFYYALIADLGDVADVPRRTEIGNQEKKFFDTLPDDLSRITFGFYSCHDPFSTAFYSEGAWPLYYDVLVERRAQFSVGGGDQVYVDTNDKEDMYSVWQWLANYKNQIIEAFSDGDKLRDEEVLEYFAKIYRSYYRIYWNFVNLKKCYERFPQYMIWDDHEIMDGWGSYTEDERKKKLNKLFQNDDENMNYRLVQLMFRAAKQVYYEYQHVHNPGTRIDLSPDNNNLCEWDYRFKVGKFAFYMLDMRGHHDYERRDQGNALLGDLQMKRFKKWLKSPGVKTAKSAFVISPVPVVHWGPLVSSLDVGSLKDDLRDEWEHESNTDERNTFLDAVLSFSSDNNCPVVVLSGDVHSASVYQLENYAQYPNAKVFNATSSAVSRKPAPQKAEYFLKKTGEIAGYDGGYATRLYALSGEYNFFMVTADSQGSEVSVSLDLYWPAGDDREVVKKKIKLM